MGGVALSSPKKSDESVDIPCHKFRATSLSNNHHYKVEKVLVVLVAFLAPAICQYIHSHQMHLESNRHSCFQESSSITSLPIAHGKLGWST